MRTMQRLGVGLAAVALVGGIAACGDDDGDAATTTTAAPAAERGSERAFCDAVIEFNTAAFQVDISDDSTADEVKEVGGELRPLSQVLVDEAPAGLETLSAEVDGFIAPMVDGDATAFNADSAFETYMQFIGQATEACGFVTVDVTARDYAFDAPDVVPAGNVSFTFTNTSDAEEHEMVILSKADGVSLDWDELLALPEDEAQSKSQFHTAAFAPPGESGSTLAALEPGDYVMVCFIPVGGAEDGPPHFSQGMLHPFTVE